MNGLSRPLSGRLESKSRECMRESVAGRSRCRRSWAEWLVTAKRMQTQGGETHSSLLAAFVAVRLLTMPVVVELGEALGGAHSVGRDVVPSTDSSGGCRCSVAVNEIVDDDGRQLGRVDG